LDNVQNDAGQLLAHAEATRRAVRGRAAWDYRAYFAWALWLLVFLPALDFINGTAWGVVMTVASATGSLLTVLYFATRSSRVHLARAMRMRRWFLFWAAWIPWFAVCVVAASALRDDIGFAFTLAAVAGALPCLLAGFASWRTR
jgi:hypothetical protein